MRKHVRGGGNGGGGVGQTWEVFRINVMYDTFGGAFRSESGRVEPESSEPVKPKRFQSPISTIVTRNGPQKDGMFVCRTLVFKDDYKRAFFFIN